MGVAILDVDGTLVDTNYQHALAWFRAFHSRQIALPLWRIHRGIGMGGDQFVEALTDARVEAEQGEQIREAETGFYQQMIDEVELLAGARELIEDLRARDHQVVLASSAKQQEIEHYLDLLDARRLGVEWTSSADVEATKPEPDLVNVALQKTGARPADAVMIGDSTWDVEAAKRAGVQTITVMTGGFSREELLEAGASEVFESVEQLRKALASTPLG